jgi:photosystem II stability/assembly factor-like uncharacterized protein
MKLIKRGMTKVIFVLASVLLCSEVHAQTWRLVGLDSLKVFYVYAKGDTLWAGTASLIKYEIYYSLSRGRQWVRVPDSDTSFGGWLKLRYVNPAKNLEIYAVDAKGRGLRSKDGGRSWEVLWDSVLAVKNSPYESVKTLLVSPHNSEVLFAIVSTGFPGDFNDVYRSTDGGRVWKFVGGDFAYSSHGVQIEIAFDPVDSLKMYGTGYNSFDARFYVSTDGGVQWRDISYIQPASQILVNKNNTSRIYLSPVLSRTDDGGHIWVYIGKTLPSDVRFVWSATLSKGILYVAFETGGVCLSRNGGESWIPLPGSEDLPLGYPAISLYELRSILVDTLISTLYVGTSRGLYAFDLPVSVKDEKEKFLPSEHRLYPVYPNPFNATAKVKYSIPQQSQVRLSVYDMLGREIALIVNGEKLAGTYETSFDATSFPSGVYVVNLTTPKVILTQKIVLVK